MERSTPEDGDPSASHNLRVVSPDTPSLDAIFRALARARGERTELMDDVRTRMEGGEYMSAEKLNLAIHRMLKDALA